MIIQCCGSCGREVFPPTAETRSCLTSPVLGGALIAQREGQIGLSGSKDKMRSSKSRSRSKQNRPRSLGNIINRVFDSSGPEGKVRGTPQQIIEKYLVLARDAQLSNDRVAAENFMQHAEHYTRMLAEAQREMAAEQEARQQQYQQNGGGNGNGNREFRDYRDQRENRWRDDRAQDPGAGEQPDVPNVEVAGDDASGLVETPEAAPVPREDRPRRDDRNNNRRDRRDRSPRPERQSRDGDEPQSNPVEAAPAVEPEAQAVTPVVEAPADVPAEAAKPRRPRAPKKPKAEAVSGSDSKQEAAE